MASNELKLDVPSGFAWSLYALGLLADAEWESEKRVVGETNWIRFNKKLKASLYYSLPSCIINKHHIKVKFLNRCHDLNFYPYRIFVHLNRLHCNT